MEESTTEKLLVEKDGTGTGTGGSSSEMQQYIDSVPGSLASSGLMFRYQGQEGLLNPSNYSMISRTRASEYPLELNVVSNRDTSE
jgi:hypothetical protein